MMNPTLALAAIFFGAALHATAAEAQRYSAAELLHSFADSSANSQASGGFIHVAVSNATGARADSLVDGLVAQLRSSERRIRSSSVSLLAVFSWYGHPNAGARLLEAGKSSDEFTHISIVNSAYLVKPETLAIRWLVETVRDTSTTSMAPELAVESLEKMGAAGREALRTLSESTHGIAHMGARGLLAILMRRGFRFRD